MRMRSVVRATAEKVLAFGVRVHALIYPRLSAPRFLVSYSVDLAARKEVDQPYHDKLLFMFRKKLSEGQITPIKLC